MIDGLQLLNLFTKSEHLMKVARMWFPNAIERKFTFVFDAGAGSQLEFVKKLLEKSEIPYQVVFDIKEVENFEGVILSEDWEYRLTIKY
jgi:hypothetical protein